MTHFRTYCIGEYDADELYEKFGEGTEVPEYSNGEVPKSEIINFVEYYTTDKYGSRREIENKALQSKGNTLMTRYRIAYGEEAETTFKKEDFLSLIAHKKVVAIGEIGLDYYWDTTYKAKQKEILLKQIAFANEQGMPLSFHDR